jgi:hypothetical protein
MHASWRPGWFPDRYPDIIARAGLLPARYAEFQNRN